MLFGFTIFVSENTTSMNITLVHNPGAGYQQLTQEGLAEKLHGEGIELTYISTKEAGFHETLLAHPGDLIVVAGGDGTVRKVARLLLGSRIPIAILPLGTANNISAALEQPLMVESSNEQWMNLETKPFDVGWVTFGSEKAFFVEAAGCGAVAEMICQYKKEKKKTQPTFSQSQEEINYVRSFMKEMLHAYQPCEYEVVIDGQDFSEKYLLVEVMNIKSVGPNLWLAPQAAPGDGWLDVVLVQAQEKEALYKYLSVLEYEPEAMPPFMVKRGKKIAITTNCHRFHVDDTVLPAQQQPSSDEVLQLDIEIENDCLSIFKNWFTLPDKM